MDTAVHNKLVSFIWSIADDCLRDVYVRGKYRDVILPMVVLRRLDALLEGEETQQSIKKEMEEQQAMGFGSDDGWDDVGFTMAIGYEFYNTSGKTLAAIRAAATNNPSRLASEVKAYLKGYSPNIQEILDKFDLYTKVTHLGSKNVLLAVLEKFTDASINLTPYEKEDAEGRLLPALSNLGMGYVFEELIRKFNEENNEEAGEHFTPREVIDLMTHLVFDPVKGQLPSTLTIYDPACGSGGMLTESYNLLRDPQGAFAATEEAVGIDLFGTEINDETYAICKSDMLIKGGSAKNIVNGSTLTEDHFAGTAFNYMLSNPPYGKSWASEIKHIFADDGKELADNRFKISLPNHWGEQEACAATPRSSDGQLLFLMEMVSKMKATTGGQEGSRIASVHNGSSLFTGDAGSGESNIRRYIIENDWLEAIIQLPNNLFYNTGITTYIWLLSNNKAPQRRGKVLLVDASGSYAKLRKNLGAKNCELTPAHVAEILAAYQAFETAPRPQEGALAAQCFANHNFGYRKLTIERPKRLKAQFTAERLAALRYDKALREPMEWAFTTYGERVYTELPTLERELLDWCEAQGLDLNKAKRSKLTSPAHWAKHRTLWELGTALMEAVGTQEYNNFNAFKALVNQQAKAQEITLAGAQKNAILAAVSWYHAQAEPVIKKCQTLKGAELTKLLGRLGCTAAQLPHYGYYPTAKAHEYLTYEPESDLRDYENVPLAQDLYAYFMAEVNPHVPEAWIDLEKTKIGYEVSFNKYFYEHKPLRPIEEVSAEIMALEKESEGFIAEILNVG